MLFYKEEKVFSLGRTSQTVPYGNISKLFSEFYCYLLVTGLFREGEGKLGVHCKIPPISDPQFSIPSGYYRSGIARLLTKGLRDRYLALSRHTDLTDREKDLLISLNFIFTDERHWYSNLSATDLLSVAYARDFDEQMMTIARYVSVAFGQKGFPPTSTIVPRLYLSVFGNIHLSTVQQSEDTSDYNFVELEAPRLIYGTLASEGETVTALWSILSAQITSLSQSYSPGGKLGEMLSSLTFLTERPEFERSIPIPVFASTLYSQSLLGVDNYIPVPISVIFYKNFFYRTHESIKISRFNLLRTIFNLMMEKMGESHLDHLFTSHSFYKRLIHTSEISGKTNTQPSVLRFALEALKADKGKNEEPLDDDSSDIDLSSPSKGYDPSTPLSDASSEDSTDGGYDPSTPPPMVPVSTDTTDKDTIGLISFDKTGEGVNEDLYRSAVVALNDRLRSDDTLPISSDVRDKLNYWVNGWLYRAAISATQDQIKSLNLQTYLKAVSTQG